MYWKLTVAATQAQAHKIAEYFEESALASSWYEVKGKKDEWCAEILFDHKPETAELRLAIMDKDYHLEFLEERDWIRENQAAFPPIDVGPFYIYGSHIQTPPPAHKIALQIDAATAFGTGEHETTQACLKLMAFLKDKGYKFNNILDLGCGTGVLGMAATALFKQDQATLSDNDPEATAMAHGNAILNGFKDRISVITSEGFQNPQLTSRAPFDMILANILAGPLVQLSPDMKAYSTPHAFIILSGLLVGQATTVMNAYQENGFRLAEQINLGEWTALLLSKI